jgi:Mg-chelatase subunit ChlD
MAGHKLELVKSSVRYMMKILGEGDRLAMVGFEDKAKFLMPWTRNTPEYKDTIKSEVKALRATGGTNIEEGLNKGLHMIKARKFKNPVTVMFLLSDG